MVRLLYTCTMAVSVIADCLLLAIVIFPYVYIKYLWWKLENSKTLENDIKTHKLCIQLLQKDMSNARVELHDLWRLQKENTLLEETVKSLTEENESLTEENKSLSSQLTTIKQQKAKEFIYNLEMDKKAAQQRESEYSKSLKERLHEIDELKQQAKDSKLCIICGEDERSLVFMPCGHCCSCQMCYANLRKRMCPVCRQWIRSTQSIYM